MLSQTNRTIIFAYLCSAGVLVGLFAVYMLSNVILLALTAVLLAVGLIGVVQWCADKTSLSYTAMFAVLLAAVIAVMGIGGWMFGDWVGETRVSITGQTQELVATATQVIGQIPGVSAIPPDELLSRVTGFVRSSGVFSQVATGIETFVTVLTQFVLVLLVSLYIAFSPQQYKNGLLHLTPREYQSRMSTVLAITYKTILKWFVARGLSMSAVGLLTYVGLLVLGIPYAAPLAILAFALSFIPNLGPVLSFIPAALVGWSLGVESLLLVSILYALVQLAESNIITPIIEQKTVSTPPAVLLLSQLAGGVLFGLLGLLLAAPLVAVLVALQQHKSSNQSSLDAS